jgi:hypothetical protein
LPVPYFHVVFTLPARIADIAYQKAVIYDLLFKASSETMLTIAADPKHLGARIGILSVLHTWGSALTHHPHVHMIGQELGLLPTALLAVSGRLARTLTRGISSGGAVAFLQSFKHNAPSVPQSLRPQARE